MNSAARKSSASQVTKGNPQLQAKNEEFPDLIPARERIILGVLVARLRKAAGSP